MKRLSPALVALVALEHLYFLVLEMFLWTTPRGLAAFGMTQAQADATAVLAANQGLYNGFLAAGLLWSLVASPAELRPRLQGFFLGCVVVAGVYGGLTAKPAIVLLQALPAGLALLTVLVARRRG